MFKSVKFFLSIVLIAVFTILANAAEIKPVKYVFLFIGDGMSLPQRMLAEEYSRQTAGKGLYINSMPYQAVTITRSASDYITDSAASGTAIACGEKTVNRALGMDKTLKRNLESIAEVAKAAGRKVGIISSMPINHATPAAFYANNPHRKNNYAIALDLLKTDFDYFGGGGILRYDDQKNKLYCGNIYELLARQGYKILHTRKDIEAAASGKVFAAPVKGDSLPYAIDRVAGDMRLEEFVTQAIKLLDNEKGFFIMTEGGKIDPGCHNNDAATAVRETVDFDNAVKVAVAFARKHPAETLIVVTGDHETGGLTLGRNGSGYNPAVAKLQFQKYSIETLCIKFREFLGARNDLKFNDIKPLLAECFNFYFEDCKNIPAGALKLTAAESQKILDAFNRQYKDGKLQQYNPLVWEAVAIFNAKCGIGWTSYNHTALPVITSACGVNGPVFSGFIDNTDIAKKLKQAVR